MYMNWCYAYKYDYSNTNVAILNNQWWWWFNSILIYIIYKFWTFSGNDGAADGSGVSGNGYLNSDILSIYITSTNIDFETFNECLKSLHTAAVADTFEFVNTWLHFCCWYE